MLHKERIPSERRGQAIPAVILLGGLFLLAALALAACGPAAPEPAPEPEPPPTIAPTPLPDQSAFHAAWESGPHASPYDLGKGPNTYCSRCHSPQNWDPASTVDAPPNCVTCKFAFDPELRIAATMDFVPEEEWKGIGCETCHVVDANGIVTSGYVWLNVVTGEYEPVATSNELCAKCHVTSQGVRVSGGTGVTHGIVLGGSAHLNWAGAWPQGHRPSYCTDCHDPHSGVPTQCAECHAGVLTQGPHASHVDKVECIACHDASGSKVGPMEDRGGMWTTIEVSIGRTGSATSNYAKSHSIQWQVACDRCHFADNPWELRVLTADGEPVEEEE
jgi:hypothetical protein